MFWCTCSIITVIPCLIWRLAFLWYPINLICKKRFCEMKMPPYFVWENWAPIFAVNLIDHKQVLFGSGFPWLAVTVNGRSLYFHWVWCKGVFGLFIMLPLFSNFAIINLLKYSTLALMLTALYGYSWRTGFPQVPPFNSTFIQLVLRSICYE